MASSVESALAHAEARLANTLEELKKLVRVGGVSAEPAPNAEMRRSAEEVASWARRVGLENVEVLELPGIHPYVYADWLHAEGAPTVILYAHHDVQPSGRLDHWTSPPFEPEERDGRLYGRGVVDDKAGVAVHLAAVEAYLQQGGLPLNVRLVVDGEEETGSENLGAFLAAHADRIKADVIVLTDTANLAAGIPSITHALRGIVVVDVEVKAVERPLHSGMWGGPVPDAPLAMCKLLASLSDDQGRIAIDGLYDDVRPLSDDARARVAALPYDEQAFRNDAGLLEGVHFAGEKGYGPYELMWHRPALTISALEAAPLKGASNQIVASARARVGIRTVPDMDTNKVAAALCAHLESHAPWGAQVETKVHARGDWWVTTPQGPAFEAVERALEQGFGCKSVRIGCGGSIPFVEPFAQALGGAPALLIGLEDPICNAHSEDESLLLSDFVKATKSVIHLYSELAKVG